MNLKAAAKRLDVHYQTAYKFVRTGALTAVRVGGRYEVSEAAIAQFVANRRSLTRDRAATDSSRRVTELTAEDLLEELEAMASDAAIVPASIAAFAARRGAQMLGDLCLVALMDADGLHVDHVAVDHREPDRAAFISALIGTKGIAETRAYNAASAAHFSGRTVRISHVPQDQLRSAVVPELRQYLDRFAVHDLLAAPISIERTPGGFIAFSRDTADCPYTAADDDWAARVGEGIGRLIQTAHEVALAWRVRSELEHDLRARIPHCRALGGPNRDEVDQLLRDHLETAAIPVAVFGADCRLMTANDTFLRITGYSMDALVGQSFEFLTDPQDWERERENFARLVSGELDFHDVHAHRVFADGTRAHYASHRAAVRDTDATLECIITVWRPLHLAGVSSQLLAAA